MQEFCESCGTCQTMKGLLLKPQGQLHRLPIPAQPQGLVGMNFMGLFLVSQGYDYMLVDRCQLMSMVHILLTTTKVHMSEVAALFLKEIMHLQSPGLYHVRYRCKIYLHHVEGASSSTWGEAVDGYSVPPQMDRAMEWANWTGGQISQLLVDSDQKNWVAMLLSIKLAISSSINASTELNYSSILLIMGTELPYIPYKGVQQFAALSVDNLDWLFDTIIVR